MPKFTVLHSWAGQVPRLVALGWLLALMLLPAQSVWGAPDGDAKVRVVASFYPIAYFTQQVGGDDVEVTNLVPAGLEPHDWEPAPRDVVRLLQADLLVINGSGLEPWTDRVIQTLPPGKPLVVDTSAGLPLIEGSGEEESSGSPHLLAGGHTDPHVWLDPCLAQLQVERILNGLIQVDPAREEAYRARAATLYQRLTDLYGEQWSQLTACPRKVFVTSHNAFQYLAKRLGLRSLFIAGLSPDAERSAARLAELTQLLRSENIRFVFFETLASPALAETLAREVGAQTLPLNPIEGLTPDELVAGQDYFTVARTNVANLRTALECS